tara:strand:- start:309 stop:443 length:135 start_codon:yes stop_codon:yes gene_type:complete
MEFNKDLPVLEAQKKKDFDLYLSNKLADMTARIDAILLREKGNK